MQLIPISENGTPRGYGGSFTAETAGVLRATAELYQTVGFVEPWISYLAVDDNVPVGICSFKSPPVNGRVEIAYSTFAGHEGKGVASAMAAQLVSIALRHGQDLIVAAQTLVERNASHRVLEKAGFRSVGTVEHPEDGTVLEWRLDAKSRT